MLINLRDICAIAEQHSMALAAFNTPSLEAMRAAIDAAEQTGYPVIISHAEGHEDLMPLSIAGTLGVALAERSSALVCLHLDHCEDLSYARKALEYGFTGMMFDGSALPFERNVELSQHAADMCASFDAGLECELGSMGSRECGASAAGGTAEEAGAVYTDPDQAELFVAQTGLAALACSFGTVHGLYRGAPQLSFEVLEKIRERVKVPLVMHGGSGVSDEEYRKAIDAGVRKINYYTYGVKYAGEAVRAMVDARMSTHADEVVYWHDMTAVAYETLRDTFASVMTVFARGAAPVA